MPNDDNPMPPATRSETSKKPNSLVDELKRCQEDYVFDILKADTLEQKSERKKKPALDETRRKLVGPRFPNRTLRPFQRGDNLEAFRPLLEQYLEEGGDIDATASFKDYFGHELGGLHKWTLLRVAASIWVTAPNCMRLLLQHGASPLHEDSSGRSVLVEALSTARFTNWGPWNVLVEDKAISPEDLEAASLCHVTEVIIQHLRHRKMGITPSETREIFHQVWFNGILPKATNQRQYSVDDIRSHFWEMHLIPLDALLRCNSLPLPHHPAVIPLGQWKQDGRIVFLSHRWLRPQEGHPDDADNSKLSAICKAGIEYCQQQQNRQSEMPLDTAKCYLWIDYCCIDQTNPIIKKRSIQSLPLYILLSDAFVYLEHDNT